jgi:hypothetical protein
MLNTVLKCVQNKHSVLNTVTVLFLYDSSTISTIMFYTLQNNWWYTRMFGYPIPTNKGLYESSEILQGTADYR